MISAPIVKPNLFPSSSSPCSSAFLSSDFNQVPFLADGFRSFSRSAPPLQVRCAATKQVKSPGNLASCLICICLHLKKFCNGCCPYWGFIVAVEEWKTKREVLLQKRVTSLVLLLPFFFNLLIARSSLVVCGRIYASNGTENATHCLKE